MFLKEKKRMTLTASGVCLLHRSVVQHRGDVDVLRSEELLAGLLRRHLQRLHLQSVSRVEPGGR